MKSLNIHTYTKERDPSNKQSLEFNVLMHNCLNLADKVCFLGTSPTILPPINENLLKLFDSHLFQVNILEVNFLVWERERESKNEWLHTVVKTIINKASCCVHVRNCSTHTGQININPSNKQHNGLINTVNHSPYFRSQISPSFAFNFSHIFSGGMPKDNGFVISLTSLVAAMSDAPM